MLLAILELNSELLWGQYATTVVNIVTSGISLTCAKGKGEWVMYVIYQQVLSALGAGLYTNKRGEFCALSNESMTM